MKSILSIALLSLSFHMASCQSSGSNQQNSANAQATVNRSIPVDEFEKKLSSVANVQLIDVRTPEEYAGGHLNNAVNIDIRSADFTEQLNKLDKTKPVLVYCLSGGRSSAAAGKMEEMGFSEVYNMEGGIMKWQNAGKSMDAGTAKPKAPGMTMDEFNKMLNSENYVLVDFNAKWCEPCKKMLPYLEALSINKKDKLSLVKIDADDNKELLKQKNISDIPYLELYKGGKLVWKHNGFIEESQLLSETKL